MRFTKVPLIATLAAGALSLLVVLPALAQNDTRGRIIDGNNFMVEVFKTRADATDSTDPVAAPSTTYFNGVLYASNANGVERDPDENSAAVADLSEIANLLKVTVNVAEDDQEDLTDPDGNEVKCVEVIVTNRRSGQKSTARAPITDDGSTTLLDERFALFEVIPYGQENRNSAGCWSAATTPASGTADKAVAQITARDGDVLRVTATGAIGSADLTVDGEGPVFTEISPAHKSYSSSTSSRFQFTVTDSGSGLRHDGEFTYGEGDLDPENEDKDRDGIRGNEPLSRDRDSGSLGEAADIALELPVGEANNQLNLGTNRWRRIEVGRSYSMDVSLALTEGANEWKLEATDRVGNTTETKDQNSDASGYQGYRITVDTGKPVLSDARTGIAFSESKKKEVVDRSSVAVTLQDGQAGGDESLSAVDHNDFRVAGHAVTGASLISLSADCDDDTPTPTDLGGTCIENPKARVYLQLADELEPDETPEVQILGGAVIDLAGNSNDPGKVEADDKIAPGLTVTINPGSEASGRPAIRKTGEVTIRVVSDEDLRRRPSVYFATMKNIATKTAADIRIELARAGGNITAQTAANTWERVYRANAQGLSGTDGLVAVVVFGQDDAGNTGSSDGVTLGSDGVPTVDDKLKLDDLVAGALLIEVDDNLPNPTFALSPYLDSDNQTKTESSRPFITIEFAEANEAVYDVGATDAESDENVTKVRLSDDDDDIELDSHKGVRITSVTLDGENVSDDLSAISSRKYTLSTSGLSVGRHTLRVTAADDAGNVNAKKDFNFDVQARRPYELKLTPGWNLVSLPGTPTDSTVGAVTSGVPQAKIVLSYQNDAWTTAVRVEDGGWQGTLTDIVGGYGYWIQTTAFETLKTSIPETDTSSVLPTAQVSTGWNLLGVVDVEQAKAGDPPNGGGDADDYFSNIRWSVAYSYDTRQNDWTRILPSGANSDAISNGKGYWVWATAPGTLVP